MIGANSYVGARLYFDLKNNHELIGTFFSNQFSKKFIHLDITDKAEVNKVIDEVRPELVIHVASNASSKWCNENPDQAQILNVGGTENIVNAVNKIEAKIIYISTTAIYNNDTVYAKTKLAAEEVIKKTKAGWIIIRPSLIFGFSPNTLNDRPFTRILKNIDQGVKAEYDNNTKTQLTWVGHISEVINEVIKRNILNEIIVVVSLGLKSRYDFAYDILSAFNIEVFPITDKAGSTYENGTEALYRLDLPTYSYEEIIQNIISEIRNRRVYTLD